MVNLEDITHDRTVRPVHPGEVISDILDDLGMTQTKFAEILGVSTLTINEILEGRRPITVDIAIRIGKAFGNGSRLWLNLQQKVDIWDALQIHKKEYDEVPTLV